MNKKRGLFQNPNIRRYLLGQIFSFIGGLLQSAVVVMLVVSMTTRESAASAIGHVTTLSLIPGVILAPLAGVIVDRINRKVILLATSVLGAVQSLALAWCVYTGSISIFWINSLTLCLGFIVAIDGNCRNAILRDIVTDVGEIRQASQCLTSLFTIAQVVGPGIAGYVVLWIGYDGAFVLNAVSYGAIIVALMSIRLVATCSIPKCDTKQKMGYVALAGLRYVFVTPGIRLAVLLLSLLLFLTYPYQMILPVIAKYTLHGDELMYSQLASSCGMGSMTGAFIPIRFHGRIRPGVAVVYCMSLTALCMMMLSVAGSLFTASVCVFLAGMGYSSCFGILRGYVTASTEMSIVGVVGGWSSTFWYGALALSSMLFGVVADKFGHAPVLILCGMLTLVTAVVASRLQSLKTL